MSAVTMSPNWKRYARKEEVKSYSQLVTRGRDIRRELTALLRLPDWFFHLEHAVQLTEALQQYAVEYDRLMRPILERKYGSALYVENATQGRA